MCGGAWPGEVAPHAPVLVVEIDPRLLAAARAHARTTPARCRVTMSVSVQCIGVQVLVRVLLFHRMPCVLECARACVCVCVRSIAPNLQLCLEAINHTNAVIRAAVTLSTTPYDSNNAQHEHMLEQLW